MIIYISIPTIFFIMLLFEKSYNKKRKNKKEINIFLFVSFIFLFLFTAFRYDVGWDYMAYYNTIEYNFLTNIVERNEILTKLLIEWSINSGVTNFYFFINAAILFIFLYKIINLYSKDKWLSFYLFITFPLFFLNSLSVIRTFTALAITLFAFKFIVEKKLIKYIVFVFIASLFHKSAFIAIAFYLVNYIKVKRFSVVLIVISMPVLSYIMNYIVNMYFPQYLIYFQETSIQEGTKAVFIFVILAIICYFLWDKIIYKDIVAETYLKIYIIGVAIYLMFFNQGTISHRLSLYGTIFFILLLPKVVSIFVKKEQFIIKFVIYIIFFIFYLYIVTVGNETYIPYKTIFYKNY